MLIIMHDWLSQKIKDVQHLVHDCHIVQVVTKPTSKVFENVQEFDQTHGLSMDKATYW